VKLKEKSREFDPAGLNDDPDRVFDKIIFTAEGRPPAQRENVEFTILSVFP